MAVNRKRALPFGDRDADETEEREQSPESQTDDRSEQDSNEDEDLDEEEDEDLDLDEEEEEQDPEEVEKLELIEKLNKELHASKANLNHLRTLQEELDQVTLFFFFLFCSLRLGK